MHAGAIRGARIRRVGAGGEMFFGANEVTAKTARLHLEVMRAAEAEGATFANSELQRLVGKRTSGS